MFAFIKTFSVLSINICMFLVLEQILSVRLVLGNIRLLVKSANIKYFSYFLTKTYVVGTQKNRLNKTVLLSTQNIC